jgi:TonB family protein
MNKCTRSFPSEIFRLVAAAALASAATWATAGDVTLAAISPSSAAADPGAVQDLGRIDVGADYDAQVLRTLLRHARHPDKFQASPRKLNGKVDVDFEVNPDGSLKQAVIAQSSHSNALDGAALRVVERARFLPVPAEAQPDGRPRRYFVTFDYRYDDAN